MTQAGTPIGDTLAAWVTLSRENTVGSLLKSGLSLEPS